MPRSRSRGGRSPNRPHAQTRPAPERIVRGQAMDLGDLGGEAVEPVLATFWYFGRTFRVNPDLTETTLIDMLDAAKSVTVTDPRAALTEADAEAIMGQVEQTKSYVREHIHPDDFATFWATAKANRQGVQRLMQVCWRIVELISERPTSPPSGSSDGRPGIRRNSPGGVSSPVAGVPEIDGSWWPEGLPYNPDAVAVVEEFERRGRPDLANQIMVTNERRAAASAGRTG